jgi:DNA-binding transcriptional LysR family regulator
LPRALGRFRIEHPGVSLQLRIRNTAQVEKLVASGEVELGIVGDSSGLDESFTADPWLDDELVVLVNSQHLLARRRSVAPATLAGESYIAREDGSSTRRVAESLFEQLSVTLKPAMELGSTEAIREAVAAGLGVALVSKYAMLPSDRRVVAVRLEGVAWRRRFSVIRRSSAPLGPAAARFREVLLEGAYLDKSEASPARPKRRGAAR